MQMLYDSEQFVVVHNNANEDVPKALARHGFEIVNKTTNQTVYLDGAFADIFQTHINAWQIDVPTQEEVEDILEGLTALAQAPLIIH